MNWIHRWYLKLRNSRLHEASKVFQHPENKRWIISSSSLRVHTEPHSSPDHPHHQHISSSPVQGLCNTNLKIIIIIKQQKILDSSYSAPLRWSAEIFSTSSWSLHRQGNSEVWPELNIFERLCHLSVNITGKSAPGTFSWRTILLPGNGEGFCFIKNNRFKWFQIENNFFSLLIIIKCMKKWNQDEVGKTASKTIKPVLQ